MSDESLPIWRGANRFLLSIEKVVKHFPRYHKYNLGSELRKNALQICNLVHRVWQQKKQKLTEPLLLCAGLTVNNVCMGNLATNRMSITKASSATTYIKVNNMNIKKQFYISLIIFSFSSNVMSQTCKTSSVTATTPTSDFTVNGDGTVTHLNTGLMWKVCVEGQTWANNACTGTGTHFGSWNAALQIPDTVNATDNYTDWRLPNVKELFSIVEIQCYDPAINETIFPSTHASEHWTSSPDSQVGASEAYSWLVNFFEGEFQSTKRAYKWGRVRLVRGGG